MCTCKLEDKIIKIKLQMEAFAIATQLGSKWRAFGDSQIGWGGDDLLRSWSRDYALGVEVQSRILA